MAKSVSIPIIPWEFGYDYTISTAPRREDVVWIEVKNSRGETLYVIDEQLLKFHENTLENHLRFESIELVAFTEAATTCVLRGTDP